MRTFGQSFLLISVSQFTAGRSLKKITGAIITTMIFNLYFHPLQNLPGPRFFTASRFSYMYTALNGHLAKLFTCLPTLRKEVPGNDKQTSIGCKANYLTFLFSFLFFLFQPTNKIPSQRSSIFNSSSSISSVFSSRSSTPPSPAPIFFFFLILGEGREEPGGEEEEEEKEGY